MAKAAFVQFKGFRAEDGDEVEDQRFDFERLEFTRRPAWLETLMESGRVNIGYAPKTDADQLPKRALIYNAPGAWFPIVIEPDAYIIDLGGGVVRVVDRASFEAVVKTTG